VHSEPEVQALLSRGIAREPPSTHDLEVVKAKTGGIIQPCYFTDADVVFLALHGGTGEDGTVQAVFTAAGVLYTGRDHIGCWKDSFRGANLPSGFSVTGH
jgi:D-alanine-D-alanine ligase